MSKIKTLSLLSIIIILFGSSSLLNTAEATTTLENDISTTEALSFPPNQFFVGKIIIIESQSGNNALQGGVLKTATVSISWGDRAGEKIEIPYGGDFANSGPAELKIGNYVVLMKTQAAGEISYYIVDRIRLHGLFLILIFFLAVVGYFGGRHGLGALLGLAISIIIIAIGIIPAILAGYNPFFIGFIGASLIACLSLYFAHGYNPKTTVALWSTLITLVIAFALSLFSVWITGLFGLGSEEARILSLNLENPINFQGLLVVAIILGTLGVLDDTTVNQTHIVHELAEANPRLSRKELYTRSLKIGREHIASLVNTLFLAYIAAFLPLFILLSMAQEPLWVTLNRDIIGEEILRSILGSISLILAIPISSYLAARNVKKHTGGAVSPKE